MSTGDTPIEIFNSTAELVPMSHVRAIDARLTDHHVYHKLVIYSGHEHGVTYGDRAMPATIDFFKQQLG